MESKPIENEMKKSYLEYAMSVIVSRAIPDVRDGLKPVQRRILYSMYENGFSSDKPYKKSARIVGETMGKYHPHGDSAIYDAMARMAQDFSLRYMLIDGQGNFGSIDGDEPAAMRYTEARLTPLSEAMIEDIDRNTVPFYLNFDGSLEQPEYLPSKIPNLLINGGSGIAVGMATNMLPHNLVEVCNAIIMTVKNPEATVEDMLNIIRGPDFPGGGILWFNKDLKDAYTNGRGKVRCRGEVNTEQKKHIIIHSLPYNVNKALFLEKLAKKLNDGIITGITDIRDESDREGMRIVIKVSDDELKDLVLNQLYMHTELEQSLGIINLVLEDNQPKQMNLKEIIGSFIRHRLNVILKRSKFDLEKFKDREHILEGLNIALGSIDDIIEIIRKSKDGPEAKIRLKEQFTFSDKQVDSILDIRLQRLTTMEREKVEKELNDVRENISRVEKIISDENVRRSILIEELKSVISKFGDKRRTEVMAGDIEIINMEDAIPVEESVLILTEKGFIKRVTLDEYRSQKRGGRGVQTKVRSEDQVRDIFNCSSHDPVLFFTSSGRVYNMKAYSIGSKSRKGASVIASTFLNLMPGENVSHMMRGVLPEGGYILITTTRGYIKKTPVLEYANIRSNGIKAITLEDKDFLSSVFYATDEMDAVIVSDTGRASRFRISELRATGRASRGVRAMRIDKNEAILSAFPISKGETILTVSRRGLVKRTQESEFTRHHRGTAGVKIMKVTERTGKLVSAMPVNEEDEIIVITKEEQTLRTPVSSIRVIGRNSQGVSLINLSDTDSVISVGKVELS
jgi:DNA gyrase subunit A